MRSYDALIETDEAFASSTFNTVGVNIAEGGQNGLHSRIGGSNLDGRFEEYLGYTPHTKGSIIPVMLSYPKFFNYMPNKEALIRNHKSIMETRCKTIDGLTSTKEVQTGEVQLGNSTEVIEMPLNVTIARSNITASLQDIANRMIQRYLDFYIDYGIMHYAYKRPLAIHFVDDDVKKKPWLPDMYSFAMLYIEPDITYTIVQNAWMCAHMWPKGSGDNTGNKTETMERSLLEHSISFTSITSSDPHVHAYAQTVLDDMNILKTLPEETIIPPFEEIDDSVSKQDVGFDYVPVV